MVLLSRFFGRRRDDGPGAPAVLTREQFADLYLTMLAERASELSAQRVGDDVRLGWSGGGTMMQFLGNAYAHYREDRAALDPVLEAQLASARAAAAPEQSLDLTLVLPMIKSRSWLATATAQAGPGVAFVTRPFVSDLIIVLAQNQPSTLAYVKVTDLNDTGDEAIVFARALANLAVRVPEIETIGADGRYRIELDGFFDASLILLAADWVVPLMLEGHPVFALPSRDQLMVCGSDNVKAVTELAEIAPLIAADAAYAISGSLLTLRDGKLYALDH